MSRRVVVPLVLTLTFLLVVAALLVVGGLVVRSVVATSFRNTQGLRAARIVVAEVLRDQLDEETGMRGYVAAREPVLLDPFYAGRAELPVALERLRHVILEYNVPGGLPALHDATATNRRWIKEVATPLLSPKHANPRLEVLGKDLVDRFRGDMGVVDEVLASESARSDERAQLAILAVGMLAFGAVAAVLVAAAFFTVAQYRLGLSLEKQRAAAEEGRRQSTAMRAAYEAEKRIADTLQEAFAQRRLPQLRAVRFSAAYVPAMEETKVGGDWYDVFELSQERALFVIGDVAGHGIEAAVAMDQARQTLVSCALIDPTPGRVLERVNGELVRSRSPMITAIVGLVDARGHAFSYASAGHPAPILIEPGEAPTMLAFGSLPLGVSAGTVYRTHHVPSVPGAMLVLYTDGAVEYSRDVLAGEAMLLEAIEQAATRRSVDAASAIHAAILGDQKSADDVAILTIRFADAAVTSVSA